MTKLEPTRTSSDLTATERLRRLLDERGVEWRGGLPNETIVTDPIDVLYVQRTDGMIHVYIRSYLTPEQAVEATLGDVPRLPYFWTADGTLHVELPKLPESISVRLPDQRDREVGSARTWQYTRGSGTCKMDYLCDGYLYFKSYWCRECDERFAYRLIGHDDALPKYCPNCGAKVVDE